MTVEIQNINTKPESDPYHADTGGISKTVFWLDPEKKICGVEQEYRTNSTSMDRWHGLELTWNIPGYPSDSNMREWIEENQAVLEEICNGFTYEWNGSNHVGIYSEDARQCIEDIERELDSGYLGSYYEYWTVEEWLEYSLDAIRPEMTDQELNELAEEFSLRESWVVLDSDILGYITQIRDQKQLEFE